MSKAIYNKRWEFCLTDEGRCISSVFAESAPGVPTPERDNGMLEGAKEFFRLYAGSDDPKVPVPWFPKVKNASITKEGKSEAWGGGYQGKQVDQWTMEFFDGLTKNVWVLSFGYPEGYAFEIFENWIALKKRLFEISRQDWRLTECLECGAEYSKPGHVEPMGMGCDRCN